jgi:hypothetical protein
MWCKGKGFLKHSQRGLRGSKEGKQMTVLGRNNMESSRGEQGCKKSSIGLELRKEG